MKSPSKRKRRKRPRNLQTNKPLKKLIKSTSLNLSQLKRLNFTTKSRKFLSLDHQLIQSKRLKGKRKHSRESMNSKTKL